MMPFEWNEWNVKRLEELVNKKWTASRIAFDLGTSRSAVLGKAKRSGLSLSGKGPPQRAKYAPPAKRNKGTGVTTLDRFKARARFRSPPKPLEIKVPLECPPSLNVPYEENMGCADITDTAKNLCCGHDVVVGKRYCAFHQNLYSGGLPQRKRR